MHGKRGAERGSKMITYPEMNEKIKELLKFEGSPNALYALARIEQLEKELAASSGSRLLSAVPSDIIHKGALEWADIQESDGQVRKDLIHDFEVGAKWAIQKMIERGIAG